MRDTSIKNGRKGAMGIEMAFFSVIVVSVAVLCFFKLIIEGNCALKEEDANRIRYDGKEIWYLRLH